MKLTNKQIHEYAENLGAFNTNQKLPVKVGFFLRKNIQAIMAAGAEIEQEKMKIAAQFGELNEQQNGYNIPPENVVKVSEELNDLFSIEQDIDIHPIPLDSFDSIELTYQELSSIMFMIEE